jgi:hypothetical protein
MLSFGMGRRLITRACVDDMEDRKITSLPGFRHPIPGYCSSLYSHSDRTSRLHSIQEPVLLEKDNKFVFLHVNT